MSTENDRSLRDIMREAWDAQEAGDGDFTGPGAGGPPEPLGQAQAGEPPPARPDKAGAEDLPRPGPKRGEDGKFASVSEGAHNGAPEPKPAGESAEAPQQEPIRVPPSLPAPLKARFAELPPEWRDAFLKRDEEVNTAKAQWDTKAAKFNRYEEIVAPHRGAWAMQGIPDDVTAVQMLVAAEHALRTKPAQALVDLARSYGVTAQHLVQFLGGAQPQAQGQAQPAPAVPPEVQRELDSLRSRFDKQDEGARAAQLAAAQAEIDAFAADPAHPYFPDVQEAMIALIETKQATTLQDAYEKAVWADPTIRPLLMQRTPPAPAADPQKAAEEQRRRKAAHAARASGSVTGPPAAGAAPQGGSSKKPLREIMREAWRDQTARVE